MTFEGMLLQKTGEVSKAKCRPLSLKVNRFRMVSCLLCRISSYRQFDHWYFRKEQLRKIIIESNYRVEAL